MHVVSISTDRKIFEEGSAVRARQIEYGNLFEELHIIVFTNRKNSFPQKLEIAKNVFVYSTNSSSRFFYIFDAIRLGKQIVTNYQFPRPTASAGLGPITNSVITCQDPFETGLAGWGIAKKTGTPLHLQIHTDFLSPYFAKRSILNHIRFHIAKFLLPKADGIRVVSERIKNSLATNHYKLKTIPVVLPIWTDLKRIIDYQPKVDLHKKYPQFEKIILMMSRLEPEKDISLAIDAFAEVVKKYPKVGLIIVGSGSLLSVLKLQVTNYQLHANVIFEPWTDDPISYYKTADIFLSTSHYEGYGLSLVEAAMAQCPIVTTDIGVIGYELSENCIFISHHNSSAVAKRIIEAYESQEAQSRKTLCARIAVEKALNYNNEAYLALYEKILEVLIKRK